MLLRRARWLMAAAMVVYGTAGGTVSVGPASAASAAVAPGAVTSGWHGPVVAAFGDAPDLGSLAQTPLPSPAVAMVATPDGDGYWVTTASGDVLGVGDATAYGSMPPASYAPTVGIAAARGGGGYWLATMDGGVFTFGDAGFHGSLSGQGVRQPIVGIAATPDGGGYWLVTAAGGVYSFGDATFHGAVTTPLTRPIVGIEATADGAGYWLVAADGGVMTFGDAFFAGSAANRKINTSVVGLAPTPDGGGYWLLAATGGVLPYGDATFYGPTPNLPPFSPAVAIAPTPSGHGYWLLYPDEGDLMFSDPPSAGAGGAAVAAALSQLGPDPDTAAGSNCNPYGPCENWCALFATWAWEQAGIPIPSLAFTGDVFRWAAAHATVLPPTATPLPGDGVLYGAGPATVASSVHVGLVVQVWPDGAIDTVDGNAGPEPDGQDAVVLGLPFLPGFSAEVNGMPVYAFARP